MRISFDENTYDGMKISVNAYLNEHGTESSKKHLKLLLSKLKLRIGLRIG